MIFKSCLIFVSQDYRADSVITNRLTVEEEDIHCGVDYSQYSVQWDVWWGLTVWQSDSRCYRSPRQLRHDWHWDWELSRKRSQPRQSYGPQLVCGLQRVLSGHTINTINTSSHLISSKYLSARLGETIDMKTGLAVWWEWWEGSGAPRETHSRPGLVLRHWQQAYFEGK